MILLNSLNNNLEKIKLFITTGLQGFYKLLILLIIEFNYGLVEVAKVGIHLSIAQIITTISSIGFCSLILSRVPAENNYKNKYKIFYNLQFNIILILILIIALIFFLKNFFYLSNVIEILWWIIAITLYNSSRHFFLAEKNYNKIIFLDLLLILLSITIINLKYFINISFTLSITMLFVCLISFLLIGNYKLIFFEKKIFEFKGIVFGFSQFISSSLVLTIVPISVLFLKQNEVGILSIFINLLSGIMIFSRTIWLNLISIFSKIKSNKKVLLDKIKKNEKQIFIYSILVFLIYLFISIFILIFFNSYELELFLSFFFIILFFITNNLAILMSSLLLVNEQSSKSFFINLCTFLIFGIFIFYSYFFQKFDNFIIICFGLFIAGFLRWLMLKLLLKTEYV